MYEFLKIFDRNMSATFSNNRSDCLTMFCRAKTVLHVGCTDAPITQRRIDEGTLLHACIHSVCAHVVGIDICEEGLRLLHKSGYGDVKKLDAERMGFEDFGERFDIVLAGDVMEHLNNPGLFVECARRLLLPGGALIVGVPSALTFNNVLCWLTKREKVHKDHCFYFSPKTLSCLCRRYGLLPTKLIFTVQPLTAGESTLFGSLRNLTLRCCPRMAPSFVMSFERSEEVEKETFFVWK